MFFLKRIFKKSPVKKLLDGGLILFEDQQNFYIDSTTQISFKEKKVIIYRKEIRKIVNEDIRSKSEGVQLSGLEKNKIAFRTQKIMESEGFKVIISPEFPLEFVQRNK